MPYLTGIGQLVLAFKADAMLIIPILIVLWL